MDRKDNNEPTIRNRNVLSTEEMTEDFTSESVEDLRIRLNDMKKLMRERQNATAHILNAENPISRSQGGVIDDSFLSVVFTFVLVVIISCHECHLPPEDDELLYYISGTSVCARFRRWFRRKCLVSDTNRITKACLKSNARIREEKRRHLFYHYYMIHPFSKLRSGWDTIMTFVLFTYLIVIPVYTTLPRETHLTLLPYKLGLDVICLVDILMTFLTGCYEETTMHVVLYPGLVAFKYLKCYFWVDLVSSFPFELIMEILSNGQLQNLQVLSLAKVLRLGTLLRYLNRCAAVKSFDTDFGYKVFRLCVIGIIIMTWATCMEYLTYQITAKDNSWLPVEESQFNWKIYVNCWYRAIFQLSLSGYGIRKTFCHYEMVFIMLLLIFGLFLKVYITALILTMTKNTNSPNDKYFQMIQQLHEYIRYKELPDCMKKRIITYYDYRFQKRFYKEREILSIISGKLKQEIILHSCRRLLESVNFFRGLPSHVLIRLVTCLRSEVYLKDDVIVHHTTDGDAMYFIASGTVAIYTPMGKEVCHLEDGAHFGEVALIMDNERRIASVVAIETCELYILARKDFRHAIEPYPALHRKIRKMAIDRIHRTMKMDEHSKRLFPTLVEMPRSSLISQLSTTNPDSSVS